MKTEKTGQNGFVMLFIIVILALIGMYMIVLSSDSNTFVFQADRAYLEACEHNLCASGLAWAKINAKNGVASRNAIELSTTDMAAAGHTTLSLTVYPDKKGQTQIVIETSCSKNRQKLNRRVEYSTIE
jgi:hypothetical protein